MKKVILCAAALMFGTVVMAQVSGTPMGGATQGVLVAEAALPGAAAGANTGTSIQNGDHNRVRVRQAGTSQSVLTNQSNGTGSGGNLAMVTQIGLVQSGSGELNLAEVQQKGTANQSTLLQQGDYNEAITRQGSNNTASSGNKARIQQGAVGAQQAESNYAGIDQDGHDNWAQTDQRYDNSDAWTIQVGNDNKSMVYQSAGPNGSSGHEALMEQYGNNNEGSIQQNNGGGGRNNAHLVQLGDNNQSKQMQTTTAMTGSGMGNRAYVGQGDDSPAAADTPVSLVLANRINTEVDDVNVGPTTPGSVGAIAFQIQSGKLQEAEILQFGTDNYAQQEQSGWGHDAMIVQNGWSAGGNNYAKQKQSGDLNTAGLVQNGSDNKAYQYQQNRLNEVLSNQNGVGNLLNTHQFGNRNRITTAQRGTENTALIVQRGGQSYSAQQNVQDLGVGGTNQIDVLQLGPNGDFGTDGVNCMFMDPMDPTMDYSIPDLTIDDVCPGC